jgi:hypothetical protein
MWCIQAQWKSPREIIFPLSLLLLLWFIYSIGYYPSGAYLAFTVPVHSSHLEVILRQSEIDERQFLVIERFTLVMTADQELLQVEEMRVVDGEIVSVSNGNTDLVSPYLMEQDQTYLVEVTKTLDSHPKGFLVNEVKYTPSVLEYSFSDDLGQTHSTHIVQNPGHGTGTIEVKLDEFPRESFWGSNLSGKAQPYGNSVIIRWKIITLPPGLKFLYVTRPYYHFTWLLRPVLGITAISDALASIAGIVIPFLAGAATTVFISILKDLATVQTRRFKIWLNRLFRRGRQRRETLEKILPDGVSVDEYLEREKEKRQRKK